MRNRDRLVTAHVRQRFLVTLVDGTAFTGILWDNDSTSVQIKDAEAVTSEGRTKADSDVFIPRARIAYMQLLTE